MSPYCASAGCAGSASRSSPGCRRRGPWRRGPCAGARRSGAARRRRRGGGRGRRRPSGRARGCRRGWRSRPAASAASLAARSAPLSRPVRISRRTPAASASGASETRCWRARISVGAIIAAWPPASTAASMARSATSVLPAPTSPCSSRFIRSSEAMSAVISATARVWAPVRRVGKCGEHPGAAGGRRRGWRSPWRASSGRGRWPASSGGRGARRRRAARAPGAAGARSAGPAGAWAAASAARQSGQPRWRLRLGSIHSGSRARGRGRPRRRGPSCAASGPGSADRPARSPAGSPRLPGRRMWSGWTIWAMPSKSSTRPETMRRWPAGSVRRSQSARGWKKTSWNSVSASRTWTR